MKITRYTQSCLLIEDGGSKILIDPSGEDSAVDFGKLDGVLYTHEHGDHFDPALCKKFMEQGIAVYVNASTAKQIEGKPNVVKDGQEFSAGSFKIKVIELPHCPMPNGSAGPQNTGYLINQKLFHPGDGKELKGLQVNNLAVPITGPDISMRDAFDFLKQVDAKIGIPIHYDKLGANAGVYAEFAERLQMPFEIHALQNNESLKI
ncbi:MBL fold metallo-hydrolase [Candidatus Saccharibacteria bacterium]|nr:MBL fold metallo-hydrolase [Candidatus Saccharibacteria bacterium]